MPTTRSRPSSLSSFEDRERQGVHDADQRHHHTHEQESVDRVDDEVEDTSDQLAEQVALGDGDVGAKRGALLDEVLGVGLGPAGDVDERLGRRSVADQVVEGRLGSDASDRERVDAVLDQRDHREVGRVARRVGDGHDVADRVAELRAGRDGDRALGEIVEGAFGDVERGDLAEGIDIAGGEAGGVAVDGDRLGAIRHDLLHAVDGREVIDQFVVDRAAVAGQAVVGGLELVDLVHGEVLGAGAGHGHERQRGTRR